MSERIILGLQMIFLVHLCNAHVETATPIETGHVA